MTGGVRMKFTARTLQEAADTALKRWRLIVDDHEAELPWSTQLDIVEVEKEEGDGTELSVNCYIEIDRNLLESQAAGS